MFGDIGKLMKLAGQMKSGMPEMQAQLASSEYSAQAGGAVTAIVNGRMSVVDIQIDRDAFSELSGDVDMLEDLIKAAVSAAQNKAADAAAEAMKKLTGGMDIPGLEGLLP